MEELMNTLIEFQKERDWKQFHTPENLAKSISIEAAELLEHFQWNNEYDREEVMADALDADVEEIILNKLEKTARKYPVKKAKGVSTKYDKL